MRSAIAIAGLLVSQFASLSATLILSDTTRHLGTEGQPEWEHFAGRKPEGQTLRVSFKAERNVREHTLFIRQDDVKQEWTVSLNEKKVGQLFLMEADLVQTIPLPPGTLRDGENHLSISGKSSDDILIHRMWIVDDSKENVLSAAPVEFQIQDATTQLGIPGRLTVVDENGSLAAIADFGRTNVATRPGVAYTGDGSVKLGFLPGKYRVYATRGPEYSFAVREFTAGVEQRVTLAIDRQADTRGWVSADTHIHTLSLSKHGDATLRERILTLAGENIEMAVTTEHNLHADYREMAQALGLDKFFTSVAGNEVTTRKGHFNIFPVPVGGKVPDASIQRWTELFPKIREMPGVQVITLNHPTDNHSGFVPFAITNLNLLTGRYAQPGFPFEFTAMELINSGAMRSSWMEPVRAWFALLNRGHRIAGVGSSDSHDVSRFIVGQGRTYIQVDDSDVRQIDVAKACEQLNQGRAIVSLGLIARMTVSQESSRTRAGPGDLFRAGQGELFADINVQSPLVPDKAPYIAIVGNGAPIFEAWSSPRTNRIRLKLPRHDTYLVLLAEIEANPAPYWELARPYQPSSRRIRPALVGVTNPIWIDVDGDGKFTSPRGYAEGLRSKYENGSEFLSALASYDSAVIWQGADVLNLTRASPAFAAAQGLLKTRLEEYLQFQEKLSASPSAQ